MFIENLTSDKVERVIEMIKEGKITDLNNDSVACAVLDQAGIDVNTLKFK